MLFIFLMNEVVVIKHKGNIERLRNETESRIGQRG